MSLFVTYNAKSRIFYNLPLYQFGFLRAKPHDVFTEGRRMVTETVQTLKKYLCMKISVMPFF